MGRRSYIVKAGGEEFKLRLTLAGQKQLQAENPDVSIMAIVMSAVDEPADMENLLTAALNWEGNENSIHDGAELYDRMVDDGICGTSAFMDIVLGIAHNAGLINDDERKKVQRAVESKLKRGFDMLLEDDEPAFTSLDEEEGGEGSENPLNTATL